MFKSIVINILQLNTLSLVGSEKGHCKTVEVQRLWLVFELGGRGLIPHPVHTPFIQQTFIKSLFCGSFELGSAKVMDDKKIDNIPILKDR